MKKVVAILMTLTMVIAMIPAVFAADVFTPSVGAKSTPDIVPPKGSDVPADTVGVILDDKGNVVENVSAGKVTLIPFDKKDTENPDEQKILQESYDQIAKGVLSSVVGEGTATDLVVTDLFYMSYEGEKLYSGNKLQITLKTASVEAGKNVVVLTSTDGKTWERVPAKNVLVNADGTLTVSLDKAGAIALAVNSSSEPQPSEKSNTWLIILIIVAAVVVVAAVVAVVVLKKKKVAPQEKPDLANKN